MGQCCSSTNYEDDEFELSNRTGAHAHTNPSEAATIGSSIPPRASVSAPPTTVSMALSTAAATEESGNRLSSGRRPSSSAQAHVSDWDWERNSSSEPSSDASAQPYGRPRARVESTATTRELRNVLSRALSPRPASRQGTEQHRGRTEGVRTGGRPPREHAPDRLAASAPHYPDDESTVPWPSACEGQYRFGEYE